MPNKMALLERERKNFHRSLLEHGVLAVNENSVATNADKDNKASVALAGYIAAQLMVESGSRISAQSSGSAFEVCVMSFVQNTFPQLSHLRPGEWEVMKLGNSNAIKTSAFAQYEHLEYLSELIKANSKLSAMIGNDYMVAPDVVVYRQLCTDEEINTNGVVVSEGVALHADLRKKNGGKPILHASISAKWTMRSDRAQNSRTEALNLIRNRKGSLPHIVVVTGEPLPSRISSLALGTGDIDCVYHFALHELVGAVESYGREDIIDTLNTLIEGKRLKDISDLPLDLCV